MLTLSKTTPLFVCMLMMAACGGNASRPDGGAGTGGAGSGTGGAQATGGAVGSGGAGPGTGGVQASGGTFGSGGAAQTGGQGGQGQQGGTAGGQGGGTAGAGGGGTAGADQGGRGDQGGQAGQAGDTCASAVAQGTCTSEGTLCSFGCTDACHFCNLLRCQGGRWTPQEAFPAPCFTCGPTLSCQKNAQYCHETSGGPVGSTPSYQCRATPTACLPTPTCNCLQAQSVAGSAICQQAAAGELTVRMPLP